MAELGTDDGKPAKAAATKPADEKAGESKPAASGFDLDAMMPEDEFEPAQRKLMKAVVDRFEARLSVAEKKAEDAEAETKALRGNVGRQERAALIAQADAFFESVEAEHADLFGTGPCDAMPETSRAWRARDKVVREVGELAILLAGAGKPNPGFDVLAHRAMNVLFGDRIDRKAGKKAAATVADKLRKRSAQKTSPPAKRAPKELTGEARAIQRAEEFDRKHPAE
jgi:hypothetical protein